MALFETFDQVDMESAASPQHDRWHELRESLGQKVAAFHEGASAEGGQPHTANVSVSPSTQLSTAQYHGICAPVCIAANRTAGPHCLERSCSRQLYRWGTSFWHSKRCARCVASKHVTQSTDTTLGTAASESNITGRSDTHRDCTGSLHLLVLSSVAMEFRGALPHCNVKPCIDVLQNMFMFTTPSTLHVCIVRLSNYTHCATSQVVEAALQCLKTNPAASVHALPVLKPALASLLLENTPIQRPGKTSLQSCSFPPLCSFSQTAGSAATRCCSRHRSYACCNLACNLGCSFGRNLGCILDAFWLQFCGFS